MLHLAMLYVPCTKTDHNLKEKYYLYEFGNNRNRLEEDAASFCQPELFLNKFKPFLNFATEMVSTLMLSVLSVFCLSVNKKTLLLSLGKPCCVRSLKGKVDLS